MKNYRLEILALGNRFSAAYASLEHALHELGDLTWREESKFEKAVDVIDFVRNSSFDVAIMPNPYGNEKRMWIYKHLKAVGFPVIVFDRGALPRSWFFDGGFNADSVTYDPMTWDFPLAPEQTNQVRTYIQRVQQELLPLETQGERLAADVLKRRLGLDGRRVLLVAFQRPSDTTIKYFSGPIGGYDNFCALVDETHNALQKKGSDWVIIGKKHPLEISRPRANIKFVEDDTNINSLIEMADAVLVVNSGVGLLASLWNKPVMYAGDAFYGHNGINRQVTKPHHILYNLDLPFQVDQEVRDRLVHHLIERVYSFAEFQTELVKQKDGSYRNVTRHIDFDVVRWPQIIKKKRCLYLSSVLPIPINRGNAQRTDQTLSALLDLGYKVDLLLLNQSESQTSSANIKRRTLEHYKSAALSVEVRRHPRLDWEKKKKLKFNQRARIYQWVLWKAISKITYSDAKINNKDALPDNFKLLIKSRMASRYDFIWVNYAKLYTPDLNRAPVIIDLHDLQKNRIEADVLPKISSYRREKYLKVFEASEREAMQSADLCVSISSTETAEIAEVYCPAATVQTISATAFQSFEELPVRDVNLLFVGSNSDPNVDGLIWFLDEVWPAINKITAPRLDIIGAINRNKKVQQALATAAFTDRIKTQLFVQDLSDIYRRSSVVLCPIRYGTGMKIKVVEALSYGKPMVATPAAMEGIDASFGLISVTDAVDFANETVKIISNSTYRETLRIAAQKTFMAGHSHEYLVQSVSEAVQKVVKDA